MNFSASISGMNAAGTRMHVAADNIARRQVPYSGANRVILADQPNQNGVAATLRRVPLTAKEKGAILEEDTSNIDYRTEFMEYLKAEAAYMGNLEIAARGLDLGKRLLSVRI